MPQANFRVVSLSRMELILRMGREYKALRKKYPEDGKDARGWRALALGIAIAALAEEEYQVDSWQELLPKKRKRLKKNNA